MRRAADAVILMMSAATALSACSATEVQRSAYDTLRRYEERRPDPGQQRKTFPSYDEYSRMRKAEAR